MKAARRDGARSALRRFLDNEALGGLILIGAAAPALAGYFVLRLAPSRSDTAEPAANA